MAGVVQFYYGNDAEKYLSEYSTGKYVDALFFDTKQKVIYRNGEIYGGTGDNQGVLPEQIQGLIASVEADENNGAGPDYAYVYSFINYDGNSEASIVIPAASTTKSGLMTPDEKNKLSGINLSNYVVKEAGKGLSSNDFTQEYINKINNLENIAEQNVIEVVKVDDVALAVDESDKSVNIKLAELINARVGSAYVYKGSKENYSDLPSSGNVAGDVYNVEKAYDTYPAGTNFAWVESAGGGYWDSLSGTFDTTALNTRLDTVEQNITNLTTKVTNLEGVNDDVQALETWIGDPLTNETNFTTAVDSISMDNINNALSWGEIK